MKENFKMIPLGEVCEILDSKRKPITKRDRVAGPYPYFGATGVLDYVDGYIFDEPLVLVGEDGAKWGSGENTAYAVEGKCWVNNHAHVIRPKRSILLDQWIIYYLNFSDLAPFISGLTVPKLNQGKLREIPLPLPPLPEQKRIVAILDEAFAGIDTAVANTEKNLANARELFESYLNSVFSQRGDVWELKKLSEVTTVQSGGTPLRSKPEYWEGDIPWYSSGELNDLVATDPARYITKTGLTNSNAKIFPEGSLLIGMYDTAALKMAILDREAAFNQAIAGAAPSSSLDLRFAYFAINAVKRSLLLQRRGVRQKNLSLGKIKNIKIPVPPMAVQHEVVERLLSLRSDLGRINKIEKQKLTALTELKQSLLHKAFSGELTAGNVVPITSAKESSTPPTTDSPVFAAHIMAVAYHWHESSGKNKTFGHVKAQKTLHLVEALARIDLGRAPVKDAAGPNDFAHMRTAEKWARENDYYDFVQRTEGQRGYDFVKGTRYSEWLARALDAVEPYKSALERVVSLLMPLDTQKAELVATVYAAWNNLLLDGHKPTEAEIVYEARDNWHPDKQQYTHQQFHEAIEQLRSYGMVPTGTGKRVTGQESFQL